MLALARHDERDAGVVRRRARSSREHVERWRPSYAVAGRDIGVGGAAVSRPDRRRGGRHILDVLLDNALAHGHGAGRRARSRPSSGTASRSTSATRARRRRRRPVLRAARPTPATASACAWRARWPSPRAASCASLDVRPTVFRLTLARSTRGPNPFPQTPTPVRSTVALNRERCTWRTPDRLTAHDAVRDATSTRSDGPDGAPLRRAGWSPSIGGAARSPACSWPSPDRCSGRTPTSCVHAVDAVPDDRDRSPARPSSSTSTSPARRPTPSTSRSTGSPTAGRRRCAAAASSSTPSRPRRTRPAQGDAGDRRARRRRRRVVPDHDHRHRRRRQAPSCLPVTLDVPSEVDNGIQLTADFPSLKGDPASDFTYNLTITNNTPEEQTFTFDPTAPQGWTVTASPTAEARAQTVTIDAGATGTVKVTATPPDDRAGGLVPDRRRRHGGQRRDRQDRADGRGHRRAEAGADDRRPAPRRVRAAPTPSSGSR